MHVELVSAGSCSFVAAIHLCAFSFVFLWVAQVPFISCAQFVMGLWFNFRIHGTLYWYVRAFIAYKVFYRIFMWQVVKKILAYVNILASSAYVKIEAS